MATTGSSTIIALNGEVDIPAFGYDTVIFDIQGTFSATLVIEGTIDNINWFSIQGIGPQSTNIFSAFLQPLQVIVPSTGYQQIRIRASAYTSGTVTVFYSAIMGNNNVDFIIPQAPININSPSYSSGSIAQLSLDTTGNLRVKQPVSTLAVTATGTAGSAVTLTLPSVASQYHYITAIEIVLYTTVARVGSATPVLVTSTNLPGSLVWDFQSVGAIGQSERQFSSYPSCLKSSSSGTATTIVCPATTSAIWRVNAIYYTAP